MASAPLSLVAAAVAATAGPTGTSPAASGLAADPIAATVAAADGTATSDFVRAFSATRNCSSRK